MRVSIIVRQIGHYHDARIRAVFSFVPDLSVLSIVNEAGFSEFLSSDLGRYDVIRMFSGRSEYEEAVRTGTVGLAVGAALDRIEPDVVAISGWATAESFAAINWARTKSRGIVVMAESQHGDATRSFVREYMKSRVVRLCDAGLVGGKPHMEYLERLGMPSNRIFLGYNAVANEHFGSGAELARKNDCDLRRRLGLPGRYILASARFIPKKNIEGLIEAFAASCAKNQNAPDLVILGDGVERAKIDAVISARNIGAKVHLLGFKRYDQLPAFYGLAEAFVHVSLIEQWGLVVNEAMASNLPVVVSSTCGVAGSLIEDGVNGIVVDPTSLESIAAGLDRIFKLDGDARTSMGRAAANTISRWGPQRFAKGLNSAIESATESGNLGRGLTQWDRFLLSRLSRRSMHHVS
ncbi:glycosyltransferase [Mesorhizobium sp. M0898]|uniref:glycosyltransferase n=1 Tax=Mesorhizobium sp. M0898 TaxID=2957020 RepID=UPI003338A767